MPFHYNTYNILRLLQSVDRTCQRILINFDNDSGAFSIKPPENKRNLFLQGTCDDQCKKFLQLLNWNDEVSAFLDILNCFIVSFY